MNPQAQLVVLHGLRTFLTREISMLAFGQAGEKTMEFFDRPQFKSEGNEKEEEQQPAKPVHKVEPVTIGNGWVILTMLFIAFIALGIYLGEGDECKGFMGIEDRECVLDRSIRTLMASV